jgi:hypothetical protein
LRPRETTDESPCGDAGHYDIADPALCVEAIIEENMRKGFENGGLNEDAMRKNIVDWGFRPYGCLTKQIGSFQDFKLNQNVDGFLDFNYRRFPAKDPDTYLTYCCIPSEGCPCGEEEEEEPSEEEEEEEESYYSSEESYYSSEEEAEDQVTPAPTPPATEAEEESYYSSEESYYSSEAEEEEEVTPAPTPPATEAEEESYYSSEESYYSSEEEEEEETPATEEEEESYYSSEESYYSS